MPQITRVIFFLIGLATVSASGNAQNRGRLPSQAQLPANRPQKTPGDTLVPNPEVLFQNSDTVSLPGNAPEQRYRADSILRSLASEALAGDTTQLDSLAALKPPKSDIETEIKYQAADSIFLDMATQNVTLYGKGKIEYGKIKLEGNLVNIEWPTNTITATYTADSAGKKIGVPVFSEGSETYNAQNMTYNFKTRKALVSGIVTQQGDAYMHGEKVKMNSNSELFIRNAKYTTCNLEDPHFHIRATKLKVIPGNKVVSGPFNLYFRSIPTPLGFAFGMFPQPQKKASGIIMPTYGEERLRGFFLQNGGYYFALNEYMDLTLTGQIYSKGSYGLSSVISYKKKYAFSGSSTFTFSRNKGDQEEDSLSTRDFWVSLNHTPETRGTFRISASVNAGSQTYSQNNYQNRQFNTNSQFNSNINMGKTFTGTPFSVSLSMRQSQNVRTKSMSMSLPEFTLTTNRFFPLAWLTKGNGTVIDKVSVNHNFTLKNEIDNLNPNYDSRVEGSEQYLPVNSETFPGIFKNARNGGQHTVNTSTTFNMLKFVSVSPGFGYREWWYLSKLNHRWNNKQKEVVADTVKGFSRAGSYNFNVGLSTRLYGMLFVNGPKVQAIRHVITPSISLSYSPDFSKEQYGIYQNVQADSLGNKRLFSKYDRFVYGGPSIGQSGSIGFSLNNNFEMKVKDKKDSTQQFKKVKLLDNLSLSASYNLLADSFKLSTISFSTRTVLFQKLDISYRMSLDPYVYVLDSVTSSPNHMSRVYQHKVDEFTWNHGQGLGNVVSYNIALSTSLNPAKKKEEEKDKTSPYGTEEEREHIQNHPEQYVDFNIPWDLRLSYSFDYQRRGFDKPMLSQTFSVNGNISLTENTKVTFGSGYDFKSNEITQTQLGITRDIHCWELSVDWTPFGRFTSYSVTLRAKSALLQDLKLSKQRSFFDSL